ncbi:hypothetical protein F7725_001289 [Dissostichus mawsoni]|uniref:Uncharacterized protein n=1 Tax=Dissostichus mawsoni TaxID=36200 RepID=A0A7J5ZGT8_DISMA|nr:hypothetical protein F7725_001289 [Dissostichus mawsoni]
MPLRSLLFLCPSFFKGIISRLAVGCFFVPRWRLVCLLSEDGSEQQAKLACIGEGYHGGQCAERGSEEFSKGEVDEGIKSKIREKRREECFDVARELIEKDREKRSSNRLGHKKQRPRHPIYGLQAAYAVMLVTKAPELLPAVTDDTLKVAQEAGSPQEKTLWLERGATKKEGIWYSPDGRPVLPPEWIRSMLKEAHGPTHCDSHVSEDVTTSLLNKRYFVSPETSRRF